MHSQLNATEVGKVIRVRTVADVVRAVRQARRTGAALCIAGGRHSMGGQQFCAGGVLLDTRRFNRILSLDAQRGLLEVEAGIQWPDLVRGLSEMQAGNTVQWGIAQKQTGADRLSIGGALSSNVHGRGLAMKPFIGDVESFTLVDSTATIRRCSRHENAELFGLVIGGYGLFGVIATVTLRLKQRHKVQREVVLADVGDLCAALEQRIAEGHEYGDFQFETAAGSAGFLTRGILSTYRPVGDDTPIPAGQRHLTPDDWKKLLLLAHTNKSDAFRRYAAHYLATNGQVYWSDLHQMSVYLEDYHHELDVRLESGHPCSEVISEVYVPRAALAAFMTELRDDFRAHDVNVIYGTVRLIEKDDESFLPWARERYACIVLNLHTVHTPAGQRHAAAAFRRMIDRAISHGGSYFLTYHRYARMDQLRACYPRFDEFLRKKLEYDPEERFQSEWYRHYRAGAGAGLAPRRSAGVPGQPRTHRVPPSPISSHLTDRASHHPHSE